MSSFALTPETSEYSLPAWKRVPTTADVLFSLALPYRPPESSLGAYLWRKRVWFESTFALTMLQPWEKMMLLTLWGTLFVLFMTGFCLYFPYHLAFVAGRTKYYLLGQENPEVSVAESIQRLVMSWRWNETSTRVASLVEL
ncbi:serine palmitoyltransferase small subunit-like domain-containing protein [Phanerochaete sordida]|uniref:Serine palmitoyltransferase small subunit-like domain-containing protein n=1 Tax=Phanerochaete sordida TaxID=48140 RepID=A0A9P3LG63_9APHY|nr:serine palmitoyltransferase small subunit-like domain-containing protein [Phanerochaete sordida]